MAIHQQIIDAIQAINQRYLKRMGEHKEPDLLSGITGICRLIDHAKTPVALRSEIMAYIEKNKRWSLASLFGLSLINKYYRELVQLFQTTYSESVVRTAFDNELLQKMDHLHTLESTVTELRDSAKIQKEELNALSLYKDKFHVLESEFDQLKEEKKGLEEKLVVAEKSIHPHNKALYQKYANIEAKLDQLTRTNAMLSQQVLQLQKANNVLVSENQQLLKKNQRLESELQAMQSELKLYRSQSLPNYAQSKAQFWSEAKANGTPVPPHCAVNETVEDYNFDL